MTTITASELKQNTMRLQDALREDLLVTKRDKPFVVVMDYEKYKKIEQYIAEMTKTQNDTEDDGYPAISFEEANNRVAEAVAEYRTNGTKNSRKLDDNYWNSLDAFIDEIRA